MPTVILKATNSIAYFLQNVTKFLSRWQELLGKVIEMSLWQLFADGHE
jgi:hypothetical protein